MSGRINKYFGYYANFGLGIVMICICMAYTVFFLKNSPIHEQQKGKEDSSKKGLLKSLLDVDNVKSAFEETFKKRENNMRTYLMIIGSVFLLEMFLLIGKVPSMYLYFRKS